MSESHEEKMQLKENPKNILIKEIDVENILHKYGIFTSVKNLNLFQRCFIHRSCLKINIEGYSFDSSNERFELLGDCILGCVVGTYIFTRFEDQNEGFLTQLKIKIIRSKTLGMLSKQMGLGKYVILSHHVESEHGRTNVRILEDLFESFIGALFLDNGGAMPLDPDWISNLAELDVLDQKISYIEKGEAVDGIPMPEYIALNKRYRHLTKLVNLSKSNGFLICQRFIINVLETEIDIVSLIITNDNYKDQLQHYFQRSYKGTFPEWKVEGIEGPTNNRIHTVSISDARGMIIGLGKAKKKIDAEQAASKQALIYLGLLPECHE